LQQFLVDTTITAHKALAHDTVENYPDEERNHTHTEDSRYSMSTILCVLCAFAVFFSLSNYEKSKTKSQMITILSANHGYRAHELSFPSIQDESPRGRSRVFL